MMTSPPVNPLGMSSFLPSAISALDSNRVDEKLLKCHIDEADDPALIDSHAH